MEVVSYKDKLIKDLIINLKEYEAGWFLTLNTLNRFCKDRIRLEVNARELCKRLNSFMYGRQYDRKEKELRIAGAIESGHMNDGLHVHLIVMHNNDTKRSQAEIERFIRDNWYRLINANLKIAQTGNLVDVRPVYSLEGLTPYINKTFNSYTNQDNPLYC